MQRTKFANIPVLGGCSGEALGGTPLGATPLFRAGRKHGFQVIRKWRPLNISIGVREGDNEVHSWGPGGSSQAPQQHGDIETLSGMPPHVCLCVE